MPSDDDSPDGTAQTTDTDTTAERFVRDEDATMTRRSALKALTAAGAATAATNWAGGDTRTVRARPAGLSPDGRTYFDFTDVERERLTETRSGGVGEDSLRLESYLVTHARPGDHELPERFSVDDPTARVVGVLATPTVPAEAAGENPLATATTDELLRGAVGRSLLRTGGLVDVAEIEWVTEPTQVAAGETELLGSATESETYVGRVARPDRADLAVGITVARARVEDDVVVVTETQARQFTSGTLGGDPDCSARCGARRDQTKDLRGSFGEASESVERCPRKGPPDAPTYCETPAEDEAEENEVSIHSDYEDWHDVHPEPVERLPYEERPRIGIKNVRLVQQVEDTAVVDPDSGTVVHTEDDPDLVEGENTAVVFELYDFEKLHNLDEDVRIRVRYPVPPVSTDAKIESFTLTPSEIEAIDGGEHTVSVLHDNDNPVFELYEPTPFVSVGVAGRDRDIRGDFVLAGNHAVSNMTDVPPLKVGFVELVDDEDGDRYGNGNGRPRDPKRSYESAREYLQRVYPGDVVTYYQTDGHVTGGYDGIYDDMQTAHSWMNAAATAASFPSRRRVPNGGFLDTDGLGRSRMTSKIRSNGFDVVVAIVPGVATDNAGAGDYYDYWGESASGLAYSDPNAAVSTTGAARSGGDQRISTTVAMEVGHYFQGDYLGPSGHPMAQRRDLDDENNQPRAGGDPLDPAHARHQNSDLDGIDADPPGVVSRAYDLEHGFENVQRFENPNGLFGVDGPGWNGTTTDSVRRVPSYMSYTPRDAQSWTDARIQQQLIDSAWSASGSSGHGHGHDMIYGTGSLTERGRVEYESVVATTGPNEYQDVEDGAVLVELRDPSGEVLADARVPVETVPSSGSGAVRMPSFALPFHETGVEVTTTYEGRTTTMNPIVRSVESAVDRVPDRALVGQATAAREVVRSALAQVAEAMTAGAYGEAAARLDGAVRELIGEVVRHDESAALEEPSRERLDALLDRLVERLTAVAETTG